MPFLTPKMKFIPENDISDAKNSDFPPKNAFFLLDHELDTEKKLNFKESAICTT